MTYLNSDLTEHYQYIPYSFNNQIQIVDPSLDLNEEENDRDQQIRLYKWIPINLNEWKNNFKIESEAVKKSSDANKALNFNFYFEPK